MSLAVVLASLPATVRRHEGTYVSARTMEPAFASHATAVGLLEALRPTSLLTTADRQPLLHAVLRRHRSAPHALWQSLALAGFEPIVRRLHGRAGAEREDRAQRVLLAFLRAIARGGYDRRPVFLAVRDATSRALRAVVREEASRRRADAQVENGGLVPAQAPHADASPFVACLAREIADRLARRRGGEDLARILTGVESVSEQAERLSGAAVQVGSPPVEAACVARRKHRLVRGLRTELGVR